MWWILVKDVQRFLADRTGAVMTIVIPAVLASLLGTLFAPHSDKGTIEVLVVDQDHGEPVRKLIEALTKEETLAVEAVDEPEARGRLEKGKSSVAIVFPADTSEALHPWVLFETEKRKAQLLYDPSADMTVGLVEGLLTKTLMQQVFSGFMEPATQRQMFEHLRDHLGQNAWRPFFELGLQLLPQPPDPQAASSSASPSQPADSAAGSPDLSPPLRLERQAVLAAGPMAGYNSYAHTFSGMICMFLLFFAQDVARHLLLEREGGLLARLRLSSVSRTRLLLGSGLSAGVLALVCALVVYAVGFVFFGIEVRGSGLGFIAVLLGLSVFIGGFALFLAGVAGTEARLSSLGVFSILVMSFLGGAWMPSFVMPAWAQSIGMLLPTHWATEGFAAMTWRGLGLASGLTAAGVLAAYGVVVGAIGVVRFRWE